MSRYTTALERAFDLAREGKCNTVAEIVRKLNAEGFAGSQVEGAMLRKQLSTLLKASRGIGPESRPEPVSAIAGKPMR